MHVSLSELDLKRFGNVTAKADGLDAASDVAACLSFCSENNVRLLIARVDTAKLDVVHAIERFGGMLCDTLVYYEKRLRNLAEKSNKGDDEFNTRQVAPGDRAVVLEIAREAFSDYYGHYHSDPKLKKSDCDDTYVSWCDATLSNIGSKNEALVIEDASGICGFLTLGLNGHGGPLELVLSGIKRQYSGRGVYRRLIQAGVNYAIGEELPKVFTSTQISNLAVQWTWIAQGFIPVNSTHTFHVWLDPSGAGSSDLIGSGRP